MSIQATNKLKSNVALEMFDFDPDGTDPVDVAWRDMQDFEGLLVCIMRTVGTGDLDGFKILGNSESDGSGTDVEIAAHAIGSQPDAVGDKLVLEISAEEMAGLGTDLRYVSANLELATGTDEFTVTYLRGNARHVSDGLTADVVA